MNYMLLGCFLPLLVNLSDTSEFQVQQNPRFYGVKVGRQVKLKCSASYIILDTVVVTWHKIENYDKEKISQANDKFLIHQNSSIKGELDIRNVKESDSGIYYCKMNQTWGPGTELQVFRKSKPNISERRNYMKDVIIFIQGFLLVLSIIIPLVWYYRLEHKEEAIYEEPEHDHTYEGLAIEHCGDLYEDLTAFSENPESWEVESPEQE